MFLGVYRIEKNNNYAWTQCPRARFNSPPRCLVLELAAKHIQCRDSLYLMGKQLWTIVAMLIDLELEISPVLVRKT